MPYASKEKRRKDTVQKRKMIQELKKVPCADCGGVFPPYCMDFDHRNPDDKELNIAKVYAYGKERLLAEIKKCDIVCSNCHRIRTHKRMDYLKNH